MIVVMETVNPTNAGKIRVPRNHDRHGDDDQYLNNIKLDISNFDDHLDPQHYLDLVMSLERFQVAWDVPRVTNSLCCYETGGTS